jgi:queuosine precursor transporter
MISSKSMREPKESTQAVLVPYLVLASLFTAALVVCNLLSNKFIEIDLGFKVFVVSAGILPYPLTFLMTDILSEFYGKKKTDYVVYTGFVVLLFVLLSIYLAGLFPAIAGSPMSDSAFGEVFSNSTRIILASMVAYLVAQLLDVHLFHFWKGLTKGKLVVGIIFYDREEPSVILQYVLDGWLFKVLIAAMDTPFMYAASWWFRKRFGLKEGEELDWESE